MKQLLILAVLGILCISRVQAQDYTIRNTNKDGFSSVSISFSKPGKNAYSAPDNVTRYGLTDPAGTLVLPVIYSKLIATVEPGVYKVTDTLNLTGLFNAFSRKFITERVYYEIEPFVNGLAVVKQEKKPYGFNWGAVDVNGKIVIPVEYEYLGPLKEGLMNFQKDNKTGFLDRNNTIIIPAQYDNLSDFGNGLAPVRFPDKRLYGYIDKSNQVVIPAKYVEAGNFYEGYATVKRKKGQNLGNGKSSPDEVALINKKGVEITGFDYAYISPRKEGGVFLVTPVEQNGQSNKKYGIIDSTGTFIIPAEYEDINTSGEGTFRLRTKGYKYGMADAKGVLFLQPEYDYISDVKFNKLYTKTKGKYTVLDRSLKQLIAADSAENVYLGKTKIVYLDKKKIRVFDAEGKFLKTIEQANAKVYGSAFSAKEDSFYIGHDKMVCLINLSTNKISMLPFTEASDFSEEGYFMARSVYYSFLNHRGEIVSPISYPSAVPFAEGVCALQAGNFDPPYLAGRDFKKISALYTSFKGPFSEGLAFTVDASTNKLVYIDKKGNRVFEVEGKEGGACKEGRIPILTPYGEYFFVDEKGKMIGTKKWKMISEFKEGLAAVRDNGKWGFIDRSGTLVIPLQYDEVSSFTGGAAIVKKDGAYLIIDKTGTPTSDKRFEAAASPDNGFFPVKKEGKVGVVDKKGNTVIGFQYDNIRPISEDRAWAAKDGKWALLDNKGKALTEFKYADGSDMKNGYAIIKQNGKAGLINKSGKVAVPAEYTQIGSVYQNTVVAIRAEGTLGYSLK